MSREYSNSNSFYAFQNSTADAWNVDDDEYFKWPYLPDVHSTAAAVINQHKNGQISDKNLFLPNQPIKSNLEKKTTTVDSNFSCSEIQVAIKSTDCKTKKPKVEIQNESKSSDSYPKKVCPGMGIRLTDCCHSVYPQLPQGELENQKLAKFHLLIKSSVTDLEQLRKFSWFGIPAMLRPITWKLLSDYVPLNVDKRDQKLASKRDQYFRFVDQYYLHKDSPQNVEMFHQIQKDLLRMNTLQNKGNIQKLFERVLFIWSMRHPASGYVQGINDLLTPYFIVFLSEYVQVDLNTAGELTFHTEPSEEELKRVESDCFWCVSRLLDSIQDHYTFAQPGIQTRVQALSSLISRLDSELHQHLVDQKVEYLQFSFRWMNNLLMRELPLRCVIRLWDTYHSVPNFFSEFHVYVCAAFMLRFSADLKREKDFQGLMLLLQNLPTFHWTDEDMNLILADAFKWQSLFADAPKHLDRNNDLSS